jgi:hypothetical protein
VTRLAIAIPTRNRADLAMAAVESVLHAEQPGVVIVVSDNSTDAAERDRLEAFCALQTDDVVRYVQTPQDLPMPAHWEWLWQLVKRDVAPTHVALLSDRMVFAAGALEELIRAIEREPDLVVSYQYDRIDDVDTPVELVQAQWTGQLLELDARKLIEMSSRVEHGDYLPRMLNSIAPVSTLAAMEGRFGNVFRPVSPDYAFAYRCLAICDSILYLDRSCLIQYGMARSAGNTYTRGRPNEAAADFARELSGPRFGATPEPSFETINNAICQEYCSVREEVGGDGMPPLDWWSYLAANAVSLNLIEEPEWRANLADLLRRRGWTRWRGARETTKLTLMIAGYFVRHPGALARSVKRQLWDRPPGTPLASLLGRIGIDPRTRDDLRFGSSADAIAYANRHPRARMPYPWHVHKLSREGAILRRLPPPAGGSAG